jgi:hypothetical protein
VKHILIAGLLAIGAIAVSQQPASAWVNSRFSIGLNYENQSANNSILWGAWRNGQIPAPEMGGGHYGHPPVAPYAAPRYGQHPAPMAYQNAIPSPGIPAAPQAMMYPPQYYPAYAGYYSTPYYGYTYEMPYSSPYQLANYSQTYYYYPASWYYGR